MPQFVAPEYPPLAALPTPSFPLKHPASVPPSPLAPPQTAVQFGDMFFTKETFDNVRAAQVRAMNIANQRNLDKHMVAQFAGDMAYGRWLTTHEVIAVCVSGRLGDGQHRMAAIEKAYEINPDMQPITMWVAWNVPDEYYPVFNTGKKRSGSDVFRINGRRNTASLASAVRILILWDRMDDGKWKNGTASPAELLDKLTANPGLDGVLTDPDTGEVIVDEKTGEPKSVVNMAARVARKLKLSTGVFVAGRYIIVRSWPKAPIDDFLLALESGENMSKGTPAHTMREWAFKQSNAKQLSRAAVRGGVERDLRVFINTWNAHVKGEKLERIFYNLGTKMPHPYIPVESR